MRAAIGACPNMQEMILFRKLYAPSDGDVLSCCRDPLHNAIQLVNQGLALPLLATLKHPQQGTGSVLGAFRDRPSNNCRNATMGSCQPCWRSHCVAS